MGRGLRKDAGREGCFPDLSPGDGTWRGDSTLGKKERDSPERDIKGQRG